MDLSGVALITGAASGIGQAIALAFIREGCHRLVLVDLNKNGLQETKRQGLKINGDADIFIADCDISDDESADSVMQVTVGKFGRLDYAVNCAGYPGHFGHTSEWGSEEFDKVLRINVRGTWLFMRAQLQQMRKQTPLEAKSAKIPGQRGSIVNIASTAGLVGMENLSGYVASKHAITGFSKTAAIEYGKEGIRVNAVCPGVIETNFGGAKPEELVKEILRPTLLATPLGRAGQREEVAEIVCFLSSTRATFMTGACVTVDGGYTAA